MKLTKTVLRKLIIETLKENEEKFADQADIENPELALLKQEAMMLDDKLSRLLIQIKQLDPDWDLGSQLNQY